MWSRTANELFFASSPGLRLTAVHYSVQGDVFRADKPSVVSETRFAVRPRPPSRDVALHPDGRRFAIAPVATVETSRPLDKVVFVFNFLDELRRIAPPAK